VLTEQWRTCPDRWTENTTSVAAYCW